MDNGSNNSKTSILIWLFILLNIKLIVYWIIESVNTFIIYEFTTSFIFGLIEKLKWLHVILSI